MQAPAYTTRSHVQWDGYKVLTVKGEFMRTLVTLACTECKRRNYTTKKNKQNNPDRIEFKKYCKWCGHHTLHRETR